MKTKSEEREREREAGGRSLKGRKLCIANKRIGQWRKYSTPRGNLRISRGNSLDVFAFPSILGFLFLARATAHYKSPTGDIWRRKSELSVERLFMRRREGREEEKEKGGNVYTRDLTSSGRGSRFVI